MIQSVFTKKNGQVESIKVTGHAEFAEHGADIVCAAVSTAIIVTANALECLKVDHKVDLEVKEGYFTAVIKSHDSVVDGLFDNLIYTFNDLVEQYPKYMKNHNKEG